jgi:hypothetical protein
MKKFILIIFLLIPQCYILSQGKIFFDVKTKMLEKAKLAHIKTTTVWMLTKSNWAGVTEVTGDYQLWLKNYKKIKEDNHVKVQLDMELRTIKSFGEGELLKTVPIEVNYLIQKDNERVDSEYKFYKKKFSQFSHEIRIEAFEVSRKIIDELRNIIKELD